MKKSIKTLAAVFALCVWLPAQAMPVLIGDKESLQVTDTTNNSWNAIAQVFDSATGLHKGLAGKESLNGLDLTGYIWPDKVEVDAAVSTITGYNVPTLGASSGEFLSLNDPGIPSFFDVFSPTSILSNERPAYCRPGHLGNHPSGSRLGQIKSSLTPIFL